MNASSELRVVTAQESDASELAKVKTGYAEQNVAERFRWLKQKEEGAWLLLKNKKECIGWCVVVWSGKPTHPECPDIQDLFIKPEHRNQGYGTHLLHEAERLARERDYTQIGLAVNPDENRPALRLYKRLGYHHDGGEKYLDGVYGEYEDWVIDLKKDLIPASDA